MISYSCNLNIIDQTRRNLQELGVLVEELPMQNSDAIAVGGPNLVIVIVFNQYLFSGFIDSIA
jgi:hypothetical protein